MFIEHHFLIPEIHLYGWQPCHPIKGTSHAPNGAKHTTSIDTKKGEKQTHPCAPKMVRNTHRPRTPKMVKNTPFHIHPKWCETHHYLHVLPKGCTWNTPWIVWLTTVFIITFYSELTAFDYSLLFILRSPSRELIYKPLWESKRSRWFQLHAVMYLIFVEWLSVEVENYTTWICCFVRS